MQGPEPLSAFIIGFKTGRRRKRESENKYVNRNLEDGETELKPNEKSLLDLICKAYYLPPWCSLNDYRRIFEAQGLQVKALTYQSESCMCESCFRMPLFELLRGSKWQFASDRT